MPENLISNIPKSETEKSKKFLISKNDDFLLLNTITFRNEINDDYLFFIIHFEGIIIIDIYLLDIYNEITDPDKVSVSIGRSSIKSARKQEVYSSKLFILLFVFFVLSFFIFVLY